MQCDRHKIHQTSEASLASEMLLSSILVALVLPLLLARPTGAFLGPHARPLSLKRVVRMAVMDGDHPTRRSLLVAAAAPAAALLVKPAAGHAAGSQVPTDTTVAFGHRRAKTTMSTRSCPSELRGPPTPPSETAEQPDISPSRPCNTACRAPGREVGD